MVGKYIRNSILPAIPGKTAALTGIIGSVATVFIALYTLGLPPFERGTEPTTSLPVINSFTANPNILNDGERCTLSWIVTDAEEVTIDHGVGKVSLSGATLVSPAETTTYTLTAENETGSNHATIQVIVEVRQPAQVSVEKYCEEFYETPHIDDTIEVGVGDIVVVTLCSNPSTGFSWSEITQISDQLVLEQTDYQMIAAKAEGDIVGAPGTEEWTFKTLMKGTSTISMEYSQPWQGGEKGAWTFTLVVVVK